MSVVLVPLIYAVINRLLPSLITIITTLLAASGLYLLSTGGHTMLLSYGDLLELICAFGFALHIVFVDRYSFRHNAVAITGVQILFVGLLCTVIAIFAEPIPHHLALGTLNAILITSVFATSLAFLMQNYLQKFSTPTRFALVLATEPVFAALTSYFWTREAMSRSALAGAGLILLAMLLSIAFRNSQPQVIDRIGQ
mgnify:CR=1 FL=1